MFFVGIFFKLVKIVKIGKIAISQKKNKPMLFKFKLTKLFVIKVPVLDAFVTKIDL